jgi:hypothetical protein
MYVQSQKIGKSTSLGVSKPNDLNRLAKNTYACGRRTLVFLTIAGVDPGFQVRGGALKKLRRAKGGAKIVWGISCEKIIFFSNFRGGVRPPLDPPLYRDWKLNHFVLKTISNMSISIEI